MVIFLFINRNLILSVSPSNPLQPGHGQPALALMPKATQPAAPIDLPQGRRTLTNGSRDTRTVIHDSVQHCKFVRRMRNR